MHFNIMDASNEYMAPGAITRISSFLHEDENNIRKATEGIIPIVLYGFTAKGTSGHDHADDIMEIGKAAYSANSAARLDIFLSDGGMLINRGLNLMQALFGTRLGSLMSSVASFSGIKISSAGSLFSIAGPFVVGELGKYAINNNLNASEFASFLNRQRLKTLNCLPEDLYDVTHLLGISKIENELRAAETLTRDPGNEKGKMADKKIISLFFWLFLFALVSVVFYYLLVK